MQMADSLLRKYAVEEGVSSLELSVSANSLVNGNSLMTNY
jgi:hypothetical protein